MSKLNPMISVMIAFLSLTKSNASLKEVDAVPGEIIVKLKSTQNTFSERKDTLQKIITQTLGFREEFNISSLLMDDKIQKIKCGSKEKVKQVLKVLKENPEIQYAEPNFIYHAYDFNTIPPSGHPNDIDFSKQWDMNNSGQLDKTGQAGIPGADIHVTPVWAKGITGSKKIVVAVIDTGVDYTHPDLVDNIYTNKGESGAFENNGIDDDGNGIIDDLHGAAFVNPISGNNQSKDDHSHGTHCAGTIGAKGNNGLGLSGVNWNVSILPIKFLARDGSGSLEGAVNAIKYATKMKVNLMSNSWGGGGYSQALFDAIKEAEKAGILFVAAAGNDGINNDLNPHYPAGYNLPNILTVGATDNRDQLAKFSNYGLKTVHVAAPGDQILSTVLNGGYNTYRGTSMACPHVAGMAALLLSYEPKLTYAQVMKRLIQTSTPVPSLKNKIQSGGRVNMENAIHNVIPFAVTE